MSKLKGQNALTAKTASSRYCCLIISLMLEAWNNVEIICCSSTTHPAREIKHLQRLGEGKTELTSVFVFRLEELMRMKQAERRQREQDEELEREKQRRKQGQELQQIRQKLQDDDMKKLAEQRRREKMEDKLAR